MNNTEIIAMIDRILKRPKSQVLSLLEKSRIAFYTTQIERAIWISHEELETRQRLGTNGETIEKLESMVIIKKLRKLEEYAVEVFNSLSGKSQAYLWHESQERMLDIIDEWRKQNGYLTEDEMTRAIGKYGRLLIDEGLGVLKRSEISSIESIWQARQKP